MVIQIITVKTKILPKQIYNKMIIKIIKMKDIGKINQLTTRLTIIILIMKIVRLMMIFVKIMLLMKKIMKVMKIIKTLIKRQIRLEKRPKSYMINKQYRNKLVKNNNI